MIAEAIFDDLDDIATPTLTVYPTTVVPGQAAMIHAAARGSVQTFTALAYITEQMRQVGGDTARLSGILRSLTDGKCDADLLCQDMAPLGCSRVRDIRYVACMRTN